MAFDYNYAYITGEGSNFIYKIDFLNFTEYAKLEIDGASNTGVDDVRELQKELFYPTTKSRYKIYIIDEVHMFSKNAFNALLKTLEEPPANVIFIFATTEPHKVLPTILSRCQRYDFKRIPVPSIVQCLKGICKMEKVKCEDNALLYIAKKADGGMRDALSILDQVISYCDSHIKAEDVLFIFGDLNITVLVQIMEQIEKQNVNGLIELFQKIILEGTDVNELLSNLLDFIMDISTIKVGASIPHITENHLTIYRDISNNFDSDTLIYMLDMISKTKNELRISENQLLLVEMLFIKLANITKLKSIDKILSYIKGNLIPKKSPLQNELLLQKGIFFQKERLKKEALYHPTTKIELTKDNLNKLWETILKKIDKQKALLYNILKDVKPELCDGDNLNFTVNSNYHYKKLKVESSYLQELLENHFSDKFHIAIKQVDEKQKTEDKKILPKKKSTLSIEKIKKENANLADLITQMNATIE